MSLVLDGRDGYGRVQDQSLADTFMIGSFS